MWLCLAHGLPVPACVPMAHTLRTALSLFLPYHAAHRGVPTRGTLPAAPPCPPAPQAFRPSRCPCHERQPETFAKPAIDGASAARRHLGKPTILCLINHLATSRRRSILVFRLPLRFCKDFSLKPFSHVSGCVWAWWKNKPPLVHRLNQRKPCHATPLRCHAFGKHRQRAHPHAVIAV